MNNQSNYPNPSGKASSLHTKVKPGTTLDGATKRELEEDKESLNDHLFTSQPSSAFNKVVAATKPKSAAGGNSLRKLEHRSGSRDRSIVAAIPLGDDNSARNNQSTTDGPRLMTDAQTQQLDEEHKTFMFNMNGSRYGGPDFFAFDDETNNNDNKAVETADEEAEQDDPKLIEGSAGSRIRVILGATGQSFLLLIDEHDGEKQWQSKSWYGIPDGLAQRLKDVDYVHQCSYSNDGIDWFLKARSAKSRSTRSWWSVRSPSFHNAISIAIDGGLEVRVVFGSSSHDQYIVLLGPNGYTLGSHLPEGILTAMDQIYDAETTIARIRGLNADGRFLMEELIDDESEGDDGTSESTGVSTGIIRSVYHARGLSPHLLSALERFVENQEIIWEISLGIDDSSWLIIRDDAWDGSLGIHDELAMLLDRFYSRHAKRQQHQADCIAVRELREQQRALAAAEERRHKGKKSDSRARREKASKPKQSKSVPLNDKEKQEIGALMKERQARRQEKLLELCKRAGKRREKEDRLYELAWKQLGAGDSVTVLGVSRKAGDVSIVDIDNTSGVVRIQLPRGAAKKKARKNDTVCFSSKSIDNPVIPIHDTRRLTKYVEGEAVSDSIEFASLVSASDKYEAAVMLYHGFSANGACVCKREFNGYSQRDVQRNQLKIGDRVHVLGYADATIIRSSDNYIRRNLIHVQYDDRSTYHLNANQLRSIQKIVDSGSCRFREAQTAEEEGAYRIRPIYDALTPKNHEYMYRFDEYTCREKIDVRRLQSLADDLRLDSSIRRKLLGDFRKQVEEHSESTKFEICLNTLERCRDLEETVNSLFDMLKGFPCDQDGHLQHDVQYHHKDVGQRGRLFALGRDVRILHNAFPRTLTLQGIQGELIGPLTGAFCHYVDCANSDIQLLCSLGKQMGVESMIPAITDYRNYRDKWLEAIHHEHPDTTQDEVKRLVNIILFGGSYKNWLKQVDEDPVNKIKMFIFRLQAETRAIRDQLLVHPRFRWVELERRELEQSGLKGESMKMVLFQRILQSCENVVLAILHRTFHNCGWRVRAKLFDSLLVERCPFLEDHDLDSMLTIAQKSCQSMGWEIFLVEKPLFGRQNDPLETIEDARAIIGAIQAAAAKGQTTDTMSDELETRLPPIGQLHPPTRLVRPTLHRFRTGAKSHG